MSATIDAPAWELKIRADRDYFDTWKDAGPHLPLLSPGAHLPAGAWPRSPSAGGTRTRASTPTSTCKPSTVTRSSRASTPSCCASPTGRTPWSTRGRRTAPGSTAGAPRSPSTRLSPWWTATSSTWGCGPPSRSTPVSRASPSPRSTTAPVTAPVRPRHRATRRHPGRPVGVAGVCRHRGLLRAAPSRPGPTSHHRPVPAPGGPRPARPTGADHQPHRGHRGDAAERAADRRSRWPSPSTAAFAAPRSAPPRSRSASGSTSRPRRWHRSALRPVSTGRSHRRVPGRPRRPGDRLRSGVSRGGSRADDDVLPERAGPAPAERSAEPPRTLPSSSTRPSPPTSPRPIRSTAGPTTCPCGSTKFIGRSTRSSGHDA